LIVPVLIGPKHKIVAAAEQAEIDLSSYELITTEHSEAAAVLSVAMARAGKVKALMKGALHTDELCMPSSMASRGCARRAGSAMFLSSMRRAIRGPYS